MVALHVLSPSDIQRAHYLLELATRRILKTLPEQITNDVLSSLSSYTHFRAYPSDEDAPKAAELTTLLKQLCDAETFIKYEECAKRLDVLQGHEAWKAERESIELEYNPDVIETHMTDLKIASEQKDIRAMAYHLSTGLSRNLGSMNSLRLHKHSWHGSKMLVSEYIETATRSINTFVQTIIDEKSGPKATSTHKELLESILESFGRSALTLSGGAILGMKHIGVVNALSEADLMPSVISGASAGSIVAAVVGSKVHEELAEALERFPKSNLACFDANGTSVFGWVWQRVSNFWRTGRWFSMERLETVMKEWLGDITFREAHNKTRKVLNISVSSANGEPQLLNYLTAPEVYLWSAVCASCAVPGVFEPQSIFAKDHITKRPKLWLEDAVQLFVDGSLDHDIPIRKLAETFNVNFLITSQVNPHVRCFLEPEEEFSGTQPSIAEMPTRLRKWVKTLVRETVVHRAQQLADIDAPAYAWRGASLLKQQYTGDINIYPAIHWHEYFVMMRNPTTEFMLEAKRSGELAAYSKLSRTRNCVAIELALLEGIHRLKESLHFHDSLRPEREAHAETVRGKRPSRPALHARSLSSEWDAPGEDFTIRKWSSPPTPSPGVRRNSSAGSLFERLGFENSLEQHPDLSQAPVRAVGLSGLTMTKIDTAGAFGIEDSFSESEEESR